MFLKHWQLFNFFEFYFFFELNENETKEAKLPFAYDKKHLANELLNPFQKSF